MTASGSGSGHRIIAWLIHLLTALGAVIGMMALLAVFEGDYRAALWWLVLALFVDGIDGPLARHFKVTKALPGFNGDTLDEVIDYFTYAIIPAVFVYMVGLVPPGWGLVTAGVILLASLYYYGNSEQKSEDYFFKGFPVLWNVAIFYLYILQLDPWVNLGIIAFCVILSFVPVYFVHPARVVFLRKTTLFISVIWGIANLALLMTYDGKVPGMLMLISLICLAYLVGVGLWRTFKGPFH